MQLAPLTVVPSVGQMMIPRMSPSAFRLLTSVLRMLNNALGGVSFVTLARLTGVQAAGGSSDATATATA